MNPESSELSVPPPTADHPQVADWSGRAALVALISLACAIALNGFCILDVPPYRQTLSLVTEHVVSNGLWCLVTLWVARRVARRRRYASAIILLIVQGFMLAIGVALLAAQGGSYVGGRWMTASAIFYVISWVAALALSGIACLRQENSTSAQIR